LSELPNLASALVMLAHLHGISKRRVETENAEHFVLLKKINHHAI
jgi:hypothetical protein